MNQPLTRPGHHPAADLGEPIPWRSVRRVLAVRTGSLSDVVLLTPALRALRAALPHARIDLLTSPAGTAAAPTLSTVDSVRTAAVIWQDIAPGKSPAALAMAQRELLHVLAGACYDAMIVFTSPTQSPWPVAQLGLLAGIPVRAAHSTEFAGAIASHWVTPPGTHRVDQSLHLLEHLGIPPAGRELDLAVPDVEPPLPRYALLVPGGSAPSKRYAPERFRAVAGAIAEAGLPVLVGGTVREAGLVRSIVDGVPGVVELEPVPVPYFAALIAHADVVVCNNSAAMHLADAVRTPVVVTYAGTEQLTDMPPRVARANLLNQPVPCSPCGQFRCPYEHQCLDIAPEAVATAALRLVQRTDAVTGAVVTGPVVTGPVVTGAWRG